MIDLLGFFGCGGDLCRNFGRFGNFSIILLNYAKLRGAVW